MAKFPIFSGYSTEVFQEFIEKLERHFLPSFTKDQKLALLKATLRGAARVELHRVEKHNEGPLSYEVLVEHLSKTFNSERAMVRRQFDFMALRQTPDESPEELFTRIEQAGCLAGVADYEVYGHQFAKALDEDVLMYCHTRGAYQLPELLRVAQSYWAARHPDPYRPCQLCESKAHAIADCPFLHKARTVVRRQRRHM